MRGRAEYDAAIAELEKAGALAPEDTNIRARLAEVRKACRGERDILQRSELKC